MQRAGQRAILVGVVLGAVGVRMYVARYIEAAGPAGLQAASSIAAAAHMDHTPKHGGLVLMNGDIHFEVVFDGDAATGRYRVYFTDALRSVLPASIASSVTISVTSPGQAADVASLHIDEANNTWAGRVGRVDDPDAIVRVAYAFDRGSYWIDVPLAAWFAIKQPQTGS